MVAAAIADVRKAVRETAFRVHPDNVTAVRLFQGMATQWNVISVQTLESAQIVRTGLRYEVLDRVARGLDLVEGPDDFGRLQLMEAEAISALAKVRR